jgi:hypothetical protein
MDIVMNNRISLLLISFVIFTSNVFAADEIIEIEFYNDKGLMGQTITTIPNDTQESIITKLSWNNRRLAINENYTYNEDGYPISVDISGTSAGGATVKENFSWKDGKAIWNSRADEGEINISDDKFYISVDGFTNDALVRRLLKSEFNQVELFPSGYAQLTELTSTVVKEGNKSQKIILYAISGLNLNPQFVWTDERGYLFSISLGGFAKGIRKGWSLDTFEQLKTLSDQSENSYYAELSSKFTHSIAGPLLIKNARVVDVENRKLLENYDVLIKDEIILEVAKSISEPKNAKVIDATGQTLIPGLWDMHGHLSKTDGFNYLTAGVTSVRDIGNSPSNMEEIEGLFRKTYLGTHIYKAGFIDKQSEYSAGLGKTVSTLEEAKAAVDWYADRGYIQIKSYSSMDPTWIKPLAAHIHSRGMRLSGHIPAFMTAAQAVEAGFDEIQHVNMLFLNFLADDSVDTRKLLRISLVGDGAKDLDLQSKEVQDFINMLVDKGTEVDLTLSIISSLLTARDKQYDPEYADIADHLPPLFQRSIKTAILNIDTPEKDKAYKESAKAFLKLTKLLFDEGVPIIPGTDRFAGFTLLRELELYAKAGIPPIDVIRIGSLGSAEVVGVSNSTGSITVGKYADLVLIDGDPIKNMADLRKASLVIQGDRLYQPENIYKEMGVKPFAKATPIPN